MTRLHLRLSAARRSRKNRGPFIAAISLLCACLPLAAAAQVGASQSEDPRELSSNAPIEREIRGGERHVYKITLAAGTYLHLAITPREVELEPHLFAPGGAGEVGAYTSPTGIGTKYVSLIAKSPGSYRLEIRPVGNPSTAGRYEVKIEELHPATEQDKIHVAAEKLEGEGFRLAHPKNTAVQKRQGIAKYEEALALWRQLGERKAVLRTLGYLQRQHSHGHKLVKQW